MAVVGDFTPTETTNTDADPDEFTYFGETFEIPATIGAGALVQFAHLVKTADAQSKRGESMLRSALTDERREKARREIMDAELTASSAAYRLLSACLGEGQLDRFFSTVDANGAPPESLMETCGQIQGVIADRPTRRSVVSSGGPLTSGPTSTDGGSGLTEPMSDRDRQAAEIEAASVPLVDSLT